MSTPVRTVTVTVPPPDIQEIRRYAGCPADADMPIDACLAEMNDLTYRVCYREVEIKRTATGLDLGIFETSSKDLQNALIGCDRALLFAATVGLLPDRLIAKYNRLSPVKALLMQAIGTERVEALCESFCDQQAALYAANGWELHRRFSPGYGDLPLCLQRDVFAALDCPRQVGITLSNGLLMIPSKSVTALAGIAKSKE